MEEHAKIEQDLSEEQLQEVTGGCDECVALTKRQALAGALLNASQRARESEKVSDAIKLNNMAGGIIKENDKIAARIAARHNG